MKLRTGSFSLLGLGRLLPTAIALFGLTTLANADIFSSIPDRVTQNPTDIIDWGGQLGPAINDSVPGPAVVSSFNGNTVTVTDSGNSFARVDQGNGWNGNFDFGETLLWTTNSNLPFGSGLGPMDLSFLNPIQSYGFEIQADLYGVFTGAVQVYDTLGNYMYTQTFSGTSDGSQNGSAVFVGLNDNTGGNIGSILISTDSGNPSWVNDFAIDDVSMTYQTVPEPGSMGLLASALLGMGAVLRRKLQK